VIEKKSEITRNDFQRGIKSSSPPATRNSPKGIKSASPGLRSYPGNGIQRHSTLKGLERPGGGRTQPRRGRRSSSNGPRVGCRRPLAPPCGLPAAGHVSALHSQPWAGGCNGVAVKTGFRIFSGDQDVLNLKSTESLAADGQDLHRLRDIRGNRHRMPFNQAPTGLHPTAQGKRQRRPGSLGRNSICPVGAASQTSNNHHL